MADHAIIGFGELGSAWGAGLTTAGVRVSAYAPERADPVATRSLHERLAGAGVRRAPTLAEAVEDAAVVIAAVPASAAAAVAASCSPNLAPGALYVDVAAAAPEAKAAGAEVIARGAGRYVDAAVVGTVVTDGLAVPVLASGPGAERWAHLAAPLGMRVRPIGGPPGRAALVKLLRSVYLKGRDALVLEMLVAAQRHGVADLVVDSIPSGDPGGFAALADRVVPSVALHAARRAAELDEAAAVLRAAGVEPVVTAAAGERLQRTARLGLRERYHGQRAASAAEVLALIDELGGADAGHAA